MTKEQQQAAVCRQLVLLARRSGGASRRSQRCDGPPQLSASMVFLAMVHHGMMDLRQQVWSWWQRYTNMHVQQQFSITAAVTPLFAEIETAVCRCVWFARDLCVFESPASLVYGGDSLSAGMYLGNASSQSYACSSRWQITAFCLTIFQLSARRTKNINQQNAEANRFLLVQLLAVHQTSKCFSRPVLV